MKRWLACVTRQIVRRILAVMTLSSDEFDRLYKQWSQALRCFMCSRVPGRDPNRADDVCQETWVRVWRSLDQFRGGNFRAWLFRIACNLLEDERRKKKPLPLTDETAIPDKPDKEPLDQERMEAVQECMKTLSSNEAAAVKMKTEGWSSEEIAETLGMSKDQVFQLRHRAMKKLRTCAEQKLS